MEGDDFLIRPEHHIGTTGPVKKIELFMCELMYTQ